MEPWQRDEEDQSYIIIFYIIILLEIFIFNTIYIYRYPVIQLKWFVKRYQVKIKRNFTKEHW
jgi:hypothetical protein